MQVKKRITFFPKAQCYRDAVLPLFCTRTILVEKLQQVASHYSAQHEESRSDSKRSECSSSAGSPAVSHDTVAETPIERSPEKKSRSMNHFVTSNSTTTSSHSSDMASLTARIERISLSETQHVLDQQFLRSKAQCLNIISSLPLQQQVLLCALCRSISLNKTTKKCDVSNDLSSMDTDVTLRSIQVRRCLCSYQ